MNNTSVENTQKEDSNTSSIRAGMVVVDSHGRHMAVARVSDDGICHCVWHEDSLHCEARIPASLLSHDDSRR